MGDGQRREAFFLFSGFVGGFSVLVLKSLCPSLLPSNLETGVWNRVADGIRRRIRRPWTIACCCPTEVSPACDPPDLIGVPVFVLHTHLTRFLVSGRGRYRGRHRLCSFGAALKPYPIADGGGLPSAACVVEQVSRKDRRLIFAAAFLPPRVVFPPLPAPFAQAFLRFFHLQEKKESTTQACAKQPRHKGHFFFPADCYSQTPLHTVPTFFLTFYRLGPFFLLAPLPPPLPSPPASFLFNAHRNILLEQQARREIQEAVEEQERRLQRQLEATRRRQVGAEAAAATTIPTTAASTAAAMSSSAKPAARLCGNREPGDGEAEQVAVPVAAAVTGAASRERAAAVRRRRAMLHAEETRAKIYALKRKGEVRAQALLRSCVAAAANEDDIKAAAEAFEAAAAGVGGGAGRGRGGGRGVVIAGGAPRSTLESWNELVSGGWGLESRAHPRRCLVPGFFAVVYGGLWSYFLLRWVDGCVSIVFCRLTIQSGLDYDQLYMAVIDTAIGIDDG